MNVLRSQYTRPIAAEPLSSRPQWHALQQHFDEVGARHLRDMFRDKPSRGEAL